MRNKTNEGGGESRAGAMAGTSDVVDVLMRMRMGRDRDRDRDRIGRKINVEILKC